METLGQQLRNAREEQGLTLSKAAALTRVKLQHLADMENDNFSRIPAPAYAKGFIRMYADLLGLDPIPLVAEYVQNHLDTPTNAKPEPRPEPKPTKPKAEPRPARPKAPREPILPKLKQALSENAVLALRAAVVVIAITLIVIGIARCSSPTPAPEEVSIPRPSLSRDAILREPPPPYFTPTPGQPDTP